MRITVDRDPKYAPCSYLICVVDDDGKWDTRNEMRTVLVQTDYGFCSLASTFGWQPCHNSTDGTIRCPECGRETIDSITDAADWLDAHLGTVVEDPGYFDVTIGE